MVEWNKIRADYIAGGVSYRKLAEKYGVSFNTLKTRAREEQWYNLRQQKDHKTTTKIVETLSDQEADKAVDLIDIADIIAKKVREIALTVSDPDSIKKLTSAIKDLKDIKGIKSEADMREQEARIAKLQREAQDDSTEQKDVNVIFDGDIEEYSK